MFKKATKGLLIVTLFFQLLLPGHVDAYEADEMLEVEDPMDLEKEENIRNEIGDEEQTGLTVEVDESDTDAQQLQIGDIFPDALLARFIAEALNLSVDSYISLTDLETITFLHAESWLDESIASIQGIEHLSNIEVLELGHNQITDLSPLAGLTHLQHLQLFDNLITHLEPLSGLTNLTTLNLRDNQITDLSPLSQLTNLTYLDLSENQITDSQVLGALNIQAINLRYQMIHLPTVTLGEATSIRFFLPDGSQVEAFQSPNVSFTYSDGMLTWHQIGSHAAFFNRSDPFPFSATIFQNVVGNEDEEQNRPTLSSDSEDTEVTTPTEPSTALTSAPLPQMGTVLINTLLIGLGVLSLGGVLVYLKTKSHRSKTAMKNDLGDESAY
ncbi:MAG: leucine-rich repeat domain-containing protein [Defluviitaleaceae bacterium]|nr:leucine-rich repeat domain-containing protein [Defluviitaleaceae bacterium]